MAKVTGSALSVLDPGAVSVLDEVFAFGIVPEVEASSVSLVLATAVVELSCCGSFSLLAGKAGLYVPLDILVEARPVVR